MIEPGEGHAFLTEEAILAFYERLLAFFRTHLAKVD